MPGFKCQFSQIILYVKDMAKEVHFYRDLLGLSIQYPKALSDYTAEMWVEFATGSCTLALHGGETERPDDKHELIFTVDDINIARQALLDAGITMSAIRPLETGDLIAAGFDPEGHGFSIRTASGGNDLA
jgi:catechol 2,3-dioxygenase-like lactoylglutathione lyase family enzyme